jgi:purine-binding chemotaxis protein CheW
MDQLHQDISIVVFHLGAELYALPTGEAREVVTYQQPRPLPGSEPWVQGVINLRGEIVPVCNLAAALGLQQDCANGRIVICDSSRGSVGLAVDDVQSVMGISAATIEPIPSLDHPAMNGLIKWNDELIVVLNVDPIVDGSAQDVGVALAGGALVEAPELSNTNEDDMDENGRLAA